MFNIKAKPKKTKMEVIFQGPFTFIGAFILIYILCNAIADIGPFIVIQKGNHRHVHIDKEERRKE